MTPQDQHRIASFYARPAWIEIRHLIEQLAPGSVAPVEAVVKRVRVDQWGDRS